MKLSEGKATYPGAKQVWRCIGRNGGYEQDLITMANETAPKTACLDARPLLEPVMKAGKLIRSTPPNQLLVARERAREELKRLPNSLLASACSDNYPVSFSPALESERAELATKLKSDRE